MWYSYRGDAYRIGYAESVDGLEWERKDEEAGIDVSADGWDSEMIEYPCVFEHAGAGSCSTTATATARPGSGWPCSSR